MTTSQRFRHMAMIVIVFIEAALLLALSRGQDQWSGIAFGFALVMAVFAPVMFFVESRHYRRVQE